MQELGVSLSAIAAVAAVITLIRSVLVDRVRLHVNISGGDNTWRIDIDNMGRHNVRIEGIQWSVGRRRSFVVEPQPFNHINRLVGVTIGPGEQKSHAFLLNNFQKSLRGLSKRRLKRLRLLVVMPNRRPSRFPIGTALMSAVLDDAA